MVRCLAAALSLVVPLAFPSAARADNRDPAAAEVLFRDGRARMDAGDVAGACPKFAESLRLDFAPGTLLNLAACEEGLGQFASAWQHFVQLTEQLPQGDERRAYAKERAAKVERRVPRLTIRLARTDVGTRVVRDDVELGAASLGEPLPVNPGEHRVVVAVPGRASALFVVVVREGERRVLDVSPSDGAADRDSKKRTIGWIVGGVGVATIATGAYFGVRALEQQSTSDSLCSGSLCRTAAGAQANDDAKTFAHVADVTIGVGILAVAVAGYLVFSSPSSEASSPPRTTAIRATPFGLGVSW